MLSLFWCSGFSLALVSRGYSLAVVRGLIAAASCYGSLALEHRLNACGTQNSLLNDMQDLPGPGIEPISPALAGGFFTTKPPGKP